MQRILCLSLGSRKLSTFATYDFPLPRDHLSPSTEWAAYFARFLLQLESSVPCSSALDDHWQILLDLVIARVIRRSDIVSSASLSSILHFRCVFGVNLPLDARVLLCYHFDGGVSANLSTLNVMRNGLAEIYIIVSVGTRCLLVYPRLK